MKNIDEKAIIQRICQLRTQYAGTRGKSEFARALGLSPSTYNYYENDRIPPIETILKICEITGTDLEWLLTGRTSDKKYTAESHPLLAKLNSLLLEKPQLAGAVAAFIELLNQKEELEKKMQQRILRTV
jgi:transcriptional regulator with XRE-family HTH domain